MSNLLAIDLGFVHDDNWIAFLYSGGTLSVVDPLGKDYTFALPNDDARKVIQEESRKIRTAYYGFDVDALAEEIANHPALCALCKP